MEEDRCSKGFVGPAHRFFLWLALLMRGCLVERASASRVIDDGGSGRPDFDTHRSWAWAEENASRLKPELFGRKPQLEVAPS